MLARAQEFSVGDANVSKLRVGSVSFLNAKPLIYCLHDDTSIQLILDVPSRLLDGLLRHDLDVALLPVIDYQRMPGLNLIARGGGIACDGPTLTVRIFSRVPISQITALACDTDSHTSVALARVLLAEQYQLRPEMIPLPRKASEIPSAAMPTSMLLIGDKVIGDEPPDYPHQLDLGEAWKNLTGLPFVFAAWMSRSGIELGDLPEKLEASRKLGLSQVDRIIEREAPARRWPVDVARRYLTEYLKFEIGPRQLQAIELFHSLAHRHGLIDHAPDPLRITPG